MMKAFRPIIKNKNRDLQLVQCFETSAAQILNYSAYELFSTSWLSWCTKFSIHGDAQRYLGPLICVDDLPKRRPLRSTNTNRLVVPTISQTVNSR